MRRILNRILHDPDDSGSTHVKPVNVSLAIFGEENMRYENLTPHEINICNNEGVVVLTLPASGNVARVASKSVSRDSGLGFSLNVVEYGEVTGLPDAVDGVTLVVSAMVRSALPGRLDLASPGELVRDAEGKPLGCKGLNVNA